MGGSGQKRRHPHRLRCVHRVPGTMQHEQRKLMSRLLERLDCAAHDALQTRDRPKLRRFLARSLWRSRISAAPLRASPSAQTEPLVYALALRRIRDTAGHA
jgi:hypothetical protein